MLPPSKLVVGSALIYPSRGISPASQEAKGFIQYDVKQAKEDRDKKAVKKVLAYLEQQNGPVKALLTDTDILIPVPRSALRLRGSLWPAERIAHALHHEGIGHQIVPLLHRHEAVPRSSSLSSGDKRPDPNRHYDSLKLVWQDALYRGKEVRKLILIDDVVTRGSTLIGCAAHLRNAFPDADVQAFTLARTETDADLNTTKEMLAPLIEQITYTPHTNAILRRRPV